MSRKINPRTIDYTAMPLGTETHNGRTIAVCPKCKRPGELLLYTFDGELTYVCTHKTRLSRTAGRLGTEYVTDSCMHTFK